MESINFNEWEEKYKCASINPTEHGCRDCKDTGYLFDTETAGLILRQQNEIDKLAKANSIIFKYKAPKLAVDAIILVENKIVLIERKNEPYGWAFPGGFVDYGESVEEAIMREVEEETSLKVVTHTLDQVHTYSAPNRDPRGHVVSVVFSCDAVGVPKAKDDAKNIKLFALNDLPELAFDHQNILDCFMEDNPNLLGDVSNRYTSEEIREKVLSHIRNLAKYWDTVPRETTKEKLDGLAFSFLTMLDGGTSLPGFILAPLPCESDKEYNLDNGGKYYPENHHIEHLIKGDIGGCLHELYYKKD